LGLAESGDGEDAVRSKFRRRVRETFTQDWLEILVTGLGVLFLALSATFLVGLIVVVLNWGEPVPSDLPIGKGLFQVSKGAGLAVFSVGALLFAMVGWSLAGTSIRNGMRALRRRRGPGPR
jgi:hypothetical protein